MLPDSTKPLPGYSCHLFSLCSNTDVRVTYVRSHPHVKEPRALSLMSYRVHLQSGFSAAPPRFTSIKCTGQSIRKSISGRQRLFFTVQRAEPRL